MASKRPVYTVIGFAVWKIGKLIVKRRVKALVPSNKVLALGIVGVAAAGVAAGVAGNSSPSE